MEDFFVLNYEPSEDEHKLEYAFFGIFDGHGGKEAALFAKEHLMKFIVADKRFWSEEDDDVLQAITNGFLQTHHAMWQDQVNWPKTSSGLPSTSGTTASIAFIRRGKIYIGHVGDSSIVLGYQKEGQTEWTGKALTKDHKPEDAHEVARIESCGGKVVAKSGVPRVVWNRPRLGHKGPVRRSTPIDEIPFLAVARSLGDLWSYNSDTDEFVVSPHPDVHVIEIDVESHRCLIFGTDGLWNMLNPQDGVHIVHAAEQHNEKNVYFSGQPATAKNQMWVNPSKSLVDKALRRWGNFGARADNTSAVTLLLDPPGVQRRAGDRLSAPQPVLHSVAQKSTPPVSDTEPLPSHSTTPPSCSRVTIFTRPTSVEQVPATNIPQSPNNEASNTSEANRVCEGGNSPEPTPVTTCQPSESHDQTSCRTPQPPSSVEVVKPQLDLGFPLPMPLKENCSDNEESTNTDLKTTLTEKHSEPLKSLPDATTPSKVEKVEVGIKSEHSFRKQDTCVSQNKPQELPSVKEAPQQLPESLQRHSLKRLRGRTVIGYDTSSHNVFGVMKSPCASGDGGIVRRRHSSVLDSRTGSLAAGLVSQSLGFNSAYGPGYQLGSKRRTRSEDKLLQAVGRLEDDLRTSDEENKKTGWTVHCVNRLRPSDEGSEENNAHSCSTRRKKKWIRCSGNAIGRVKQARPSVSIRSNSNFVSGCDVALSRDCSSEHSSSRVLRSDTHSAMPVHTLRSQNVDLKASRLSIHTPTKFTPKRAVQLKAALEMTSFAAGSSSLLPTTKILVASSSLSKRHRQSFCGRTRSVTTRSRVKRLSK